MILGCKSGDEGGVDATGPSSLTSTTTYLEMLFRAARRARPMLRRRQIVEWLFVVAALSVALTWGGGVRLSAGLRKSRNLRSLFAKTRLRKYDAVGRSDADFAVLKCGTRPALPDAMRITRLQCAPISRACSLGAFAFVVLLASSACISDDRSGLLRRGASNSGTSAADGDGGAASMLATPMRRLNRTEYDNTVRDLFGLTGSPSSAWPIDASDSGFDNDVNGQGATADLVDQIRRSAEDVAQQVVAKLGTILPCATQPNVNAATCADGFIRTYARRAYRRPVTPEDVSHLGAIFAWGSARGGVTTGVRLVVAAMLQSPFFLYRPELGASSNGAAGDGSLTDHEIASRLSYLLTNSCPDNALLDAADVGTLHTPEQIRQHAERLLATPAGRLAVDNFFRQWLPFDTLARTVKDSDKFPEFDSATRQSLSDGMQAFVEWVVFDSERGDLRELVTSKDVFVTDRTASLYGLSGSFGPTLQRATATEPRAGILTQAGLLAALAKGGETAPIARGKFVYERLFCQSVSPPPNNLPNALLVPPDDPTKTTRERYAAHRADKVCAGCHNLLDPPGFALENYDAIGRFRTTENGQPIDASGQLTLGGRQIEFGGAADLAAFAASSEELRSCVARKWFTYAFARGDSPTDAETVTALKNAVGDGTAKLRGLILATTQTYAFSHRSPIDSDKGACTP